MRATFNAGRPIGDPSKGGLGLPLNRIGAELREGVLLARAQLALGEHGHTPAGTLSGRSSVASRGRETGPVALALRGGPRIPVKLSGCPVPDYGLTPEEQAAFEVSEQEDEAMAVGYGVGPSPDRGHHG